MEVKRRVQIAGLGMHSSFTEYEGGDVIVSSIKVPSYLPNVPPAMRLVFPRLHSFSSRLRIIWATESAQSFGCDGDVISRDSNVDVDDRMMHDIRRFRRIRQNKMMPLSGTLPAYLSSAKRIHEQARKHQRNFSRRYGLYLSAFATEPRPTAHPWKKFMFSVVIVGG